MKTLRRFQPRGSQTGDHVIWWIEHEDGTEQEIAVTLDMFVALAMSLPPFATFLLQQSFPGSSDPDVAANLRGIEPTGAGANHALDGQYVEMVVDFPGGRNKYHLTTALAKALGQGLMDHARLAEGIRDTSSDSLN